MRTISVINLKGGVGKTVTSTNLAYQLAQRGSNVLLIDCDKQGNSSKTFNAYEHDLTIAEVLLGECDIKSAIQSVFGTEQGKLDIISANMTLYLADKNILIDANRPQQIRLKKALLNIKDDYDYCIIDCAPDVNMPVINAIVGSTDIIIPVTIDRYSFDGIQEIKDQIEALSEGFDLNINFLGCLVTKYKNDEFTNAGVEKIRDKFGKVMNTKIRYTQLVSKSTFDDKTVIEFSPKCGATRSYKELAEEIERGNIQ